MILNISLDGLTGAWEMQTDGSYVSLTSGDEKHSQTKLDQMASKRLKAAKKQNMRKLGHLRKQSKHSVH